MAKVQVTEVRVVDPVAVMWDGGSSLVFGSCLWAVRSCVAAACKERTSLLNFCALDLPSRCSGVEKRFWMGLEG